MIDCVPWATLKRMYSWFAFRLFLLRHMKTSSQNGTLRFRTTPLVCHSSSSVPRLICEMTPSSSAVSVTSTSSPYPRPGAHSSQASWEPKSTSSARRWPRRASRTSLTRPSGQSWWPRRANPQRSPAETDARSCRERERGKIIKHTHSLFFYKKGKKVDNEYISCGLFCCVFLSVVVSFLCVATENLPVW